jgi:PAS domain S-box-containing protein
MLSPLESAEGILVTAAIRDISVRKAAEKHLAQMEGRYRGLLEAAPDAMVVVNQGGEIVLLNVQAEKQFGYRRDELLGQKVKNIIPEGFAERLIADGTAHRGRRAGAADRHRDRAHGRRKDGSEFPIEIMLSPLESAEGILVTAAIRDMRAQGRGKASGADGGRYRGLLEAAPDAMVVVNQAGEIVLLNAQAEKQFGYRRDELLGQKVTNIIPEGFAERLIADGLRSRGRGAGAADRHRDRAHRAAQGWQRVSDRDHAEPAGKRRRNPGDGGDPRHQRAQGGGKASGADGRPVPRAAGGGSGCDGGGEPGGRSSC